ncbi:MAG: glycosyltransferase [Paludibacter sp.]|nr:glycosyltransferase [Paludibacter sp.]
MLSIITINFNNALGLNKTIESVKSQTFTDYEYIIIDGGSSDDSVEIIENFSKLSKQSILYVSEQDKGIYNAMNKGIKLAQGDYCLFLNSGDILYDENVLANAFSNEIIADIVCFDAMFVLNGVEELHKYPDEISFNYLYHGSLCHQSLLYKRVLFTQFGNYNENYKIVSDWELNIRFLINNNCTYKHFNFIFVKYGLDGISFSDSGKELDLNERNRVLSSCFAKRVLIDYVKLNRIEQDDTYILWQKINSKYIKKLHYYIVRLLRRLDKLITK